MKNKITKLSIPAHFNIDTIDEIIKLYDNNSDIVPYEVYWAIPSNIISQWRNIKLLEKKQVKVNRKDYILKYRNYLKLKGLKFVYVMNIPIESNINNKRVNDFLDWIVYDLYPDSITISDEKLLEKIFNKYPNLSINISTIASVRKKDDIIKYLKYKPKKIILQHDVNRNINDLKEIIEFWEENNLVIEIMATESCIRRCPWMSNHYKDLWKKVDDHFYHVRCNSFKLDYPREFLKANIIRPEDIEKYEKIWIHNFKLTGRSKDASWLPEMVWAYLNRNYNWNLIRLTWIDPLLNAEDLVYIDNKSLDWFIDKFFEKELTFLDENNYSEKWIQKLYKDWNLKVQNWWFILKDWTLRFDWKSIDKINNQYK